MCTFQSMFCTRFIIASKYAHLVHMSVKVFIYFQKVPVHLLDSEKQSGMESNRIWPGNKASVSRSN